LFTGLLLKSCRPRASEAVVAKEGSPVKSGEMDWQRKLQLLARQNRGRTEFKTYFEDLERLLNVPIAEPDRLDLQTSDQLFAAYTHGLQESRNQPQRCFQKTWSYETIEAWMVACDRAGIALSGSAGVLFVRPFKY
jgi:hypothetical protein